MRLTDVRHGDRVRYTGSAPGLVGKSGVVIGIGSTCVDVRMDNELRTSIIRPQFLTRLMGVGGVTTTRREVPMPDLNYHNEDERTEAPRGTGMKFDGDKVRAELLLQGMPRTLEGVADILTFGARKYAAHSWQHVEDGINRYEAAAMRHKLARMKGEMLDPESGKPHILHELCSLMFVAELQALAKELTSGAE